MQKSYLIRLYLTCCDNNAAGNADKLLKNYNFHLTGFLADYIP